MTSLLEWISVDAPPPAPPHRDPQETCERCHEIRATQVGGPLAAIFTPAYMQRRAVSDHQLAAFAATFLRAMRQPPQSVDGTVTYEVQP